MNIYYTKYSAKINKKLWLTGNYNEEILSHTKLKNAQINHTLLLLEEGLKDGHLHHDYVIVGAKDLVSTTSPGSQLYRAIQNFERYDDKRYFNKTCEEIPSF